MATFYKCSLFYLRVHFLSVAKKSLPKPCSKTTLVKVLPYMHYRQHFLDVAKIKCCLRQKML